MLVGDVPRAQEERTACHPHLGGEQKAGCCEGSDERLRGVGAREDEGVFVSPQNVAKRRKTQVVKLLFHFPLFVSLKNKL